MARFVVKEIENELDKQEIRKGRCPWCLQKLTPVFEGNEHIADKCDECGDRFE